MSPTLLLLLMLIGAFIAHQVGVRRSMAVVNGQIKALHSLPTYYGFFTVILAFAPSFLVFTVWTLFESTIVTNIVLQTLAVEFADLSKSEVGLVLNDMRNLIAGNVTAGSVSPAIKNAAQLYQDLIKDSHTLLALLMAFMMIAGVLIARQRISAEFRSRNAVESVATFFLIICSTIAIFTTLGILLSVLFESIRFFGMVPFTEFMFGTEWSPQTALRSDQVGSSGAFGAVPLFMGTLLISFIAMMVAVPIGLMSAIYLSEYADPKVRSLIKPLLEVLAGIPTVVYGFFAALTVAPMIRGVGESFGLDVASESALAAGGVMGIMIIPFISSLSDDVINAVPQAMRDGAYALGATQSETIMRVIIPAALPGIMGGVLLAVSRAIGETMIVVMAAGLAANLTLNPLDAVTTITVQIVTLLTGDQEFDSAKTLAAFALGLMLFVSTLILNFIALHIVRKYREELEV